MRENQTGQISDPNVEVVRIARTTAVKKGGSVLSFQALVVVGDGKNRVGYATAKAKEVPVAIAKAKDMAMKNMISVPIINETIQHVVNFKFGATKIFMKPASKGTGIIAGGAMRSVFKVLGVENILAKRHGSGNEINVVIATIKGLASMSDPREVSYRRSKKVHEILSPRKAEEAAEAAATEGGK